VPGAWLNQAVLLGHKVQKQTTFVLALFVSDQAHSKSQAARDREATEYWAALTPEQEGLGRSEEWASTGAARRVTPKWIRS